MRTKCVPQFCIEYLSLNLLFQNPRSLGAAQLSQELTPEQTIMMGSLCEHATHLRDSATKIAEDQRNKVRKVS